MREINLAKYEIKMMVRKPKTQTDGSVILGPDGKEETEVTEQLMPYDVRESMASILLHPEQKMNGVELLKANQLAQKVLENKEETLLLENENYNRLKRAFETFVGFGRNDVELVRRVLEAPEVEVAKK